MFIKPPNAEFFNEAKRIVEAHYPKDTPRERVAQLLCVVVALMLESSRDLEQAHIECDILLDKLLDAHDKLFNALPSTRSKKLEALATNNNYKN